MKRSFTSIIGPKTMNASFAPNGKLKKLAAHVKRRKLEFHAISAVTGEGIDELKWALAKRLRSPE